MGLFQAQYGRIRMRMRFDPTKGLWGEAWVVPASGESAAWELDVETSSDRPNHVSLNHFTTNFDTGVTQGLNIVTLAPFIAAIIAVPLLNEPLSPAIMCGLVGMGIGALQPWRWFRKDALTAQLSQQKQD